MTDSIKKNSTSSFPSSKDAKIVSRRKAWNGDKTNVEAWREAMPPHAKCAGCNSKKCAIWIRTYYPMSDFMRIFGPMQALLHAKAHGGKLPTYPTKFGEFVFIAEAFACDACKKDAEVAAANHPSWALVEVRSGGKASGPLIQVAR